MAEPYFENRQPIYFGSVASNKEIDFILQCQDGTFEKYQVTQTLHDDNYEREVSAFAVGDAHLSRGKNILLTLNDEGTIEYQGVTIQKKNLLKWLLEIT